MDSSWPHSVYGINVSEPQLHHGHAESNLRMQHANWAGQEITKIPLVQTSPQFLTGREIWDSGLSFCCLFPRKAKSPCQWQSVEGTLWCITYLIKSASSYQPALQPVRMGFWGCSQGSSSHPEQPGANSPSLEHKAGADNHWRGLPTTNILHIEWFCQFRKMNQQCSQN